MKRTFLIHTDNSYADVGGATLEEFIGTERELLELLTSYSDWQDDTDVTEEERTDEALRRLFLEANGDGSNATTVFERQGSDYVLVLG